YYCYCYLPLLLFIYFWSFSTCKDYEYHFIKEEKTWSEAQEYCRKHFTDLATVNNLSDLDILCDQVQRAQFDYVWVGLRYTCSLDLWYWASNRLVCYQNWDSKEPGHGCGLAGAVKKGTAEWWSFSTYELVLVPEQKSWDDALTYCRKHYSDLASITNPTQQTWVQKRVQRAQFDYVWVGLRYTCSLDLWYWASNRLVCYQNWDSKEPGHECDMAGAVKKGTAEWVSLDKGDVYAFICSTKTHA
uniref:C-type lectin domain-containing protein n=1 Tax=Sphaeramia orbicularis TaxID=375764 RepID=A0A673CIL5_9TELE